MPLFKCTVRDAQGQLITKTSEAADRSALIHELRTGQLFPVEIEEVSSAKKTKKFKIRKFYGNELPLFTRQLSNLLSSGVVLSRALQLLGDQVSNPYFKDIIIQVYDDVMAGGTLGEALAQHPKTFSNLYVNMVKAGEQGDALEQVVLNLADLIDRQLETRQALISILIYPIILLVVGAGTLAFLLTYVVPKLFVIFNEMDQTLPLVTKALMFVSVAWSKAWWILVILFAGIGLVCVRLYQKEKYRSKWDEWIYKSALLGPTLQKILFVHTTRLMGYMLTNGVSILDTINIVKGIVSNTFVRRQLDEVHKDVAQGFALSKSLEKAEVFSPMMINIIVVGEEIGKLEETLLKTSATYDKEVQDEIKRWLSVVEPLMILIMAISVGFVVMAMLLPIFDMNLQVL